MNESIFEYVLAKLEGSKGRWHEVSEGSGVPKRTLEKIARGEIENPGIRHVERLFAYFAGPEPSVPADGESTNSPLTVAKRA